MSLPQLNVASDKHIMVLNAIMERYCYQYHRKRNFKNVKKQNKRKIENKREGPLRGTIFKWESVQERDFLDLLVHPSAWNQSNLYYITPLFPQDAMCGHGLRLRTMATYGISGEQLLNPLSWP